MNIQLDTTYVTDTNLTVEIIQDNTEYYQYGYDTAFLIEAMFIDLTSDNYIEAFQKDDSLHKNKSALDLFFASLDRVAYNDYQFISLGDLVDTYNTINPNKAMIMYTDKFTFIDCNDPTVRTMSIEESERLIYGLVLVDRDETETAKGIIEWYARLFEEGNVYAVIVSKPNNDKDEIIMCGCYTETIEEALEEFRIYYHDFGNIISELKQAT